jgi:WD40 repeat protein
MAAASPRKWAIVVTVGLALPGWGQAPPKEPQPAKARVDLHGDPLPEGAVARLGTSRFRHSGAVHAVAFSADGKLLAASSDDPNMVVIWDRATGRKVREFAVAGRGLPPSLLCFSPDAKRLYSSFWYGRDMTLFAWDVATGANARNPSQPADARALSYSPDGREVLLLRKEKEIVRWDLEKGKELGCYPKPEGPFTTATRLGERLLVPRFDGQGVGMWDAVQSKQLWSVEATLEKRYPGLTIAFSADGKLFAVQTPARTIAVYESLTGNVVRRLEGDGGKGYYSLSISPDGRTVAGSNRDGSLRLWDLESGRERARAPRIHAGVTHVFFAPDSKIFATGGGNNAHAVLLWDTATGKPIDPFPGHTSPVASISFSPDGQTVATSAWLRGDPVVRFWDPQTGRLLRLLATSNGGGVSTVAFSPDGKKFAACCWFGEHRVRVWDVSTARQQLALARHAAGCTCVAFSPDRKRLASGDAYYNQSGQYEGRLCLWNVESGKLVREIQGTRGAIQRVLFTHDGKHVLAGADGVHVYEADTGRLVGEPFQAKSRIWGLALSADGRLLATADGNGPVRLWELATRREVPLPVPNGSSFDVALTPDGRTLAFRGPKGEGVLFHWPSGATLERLAGPAALGSRFVFSADARRLATSVNTESSVLVWDVAGLVNRPPPAVAKPSGVDLRRWWADLRSDNPGSAYKAVWRFAAVPEQTLPFLADTLRPVKAPEPATVARWIADLDSEKFEARERASRQLEQLGEAVVATLHKAKKGDLTAEQARRIDWLLKKHAGPVPGPEQLHAIRAVAVLEQIGGLEARKILEGLAAGAAEVCLTQQAQMALQRLKRAER